MLLLLVAVYSSCCFDDDAKYIVLFGVRSFTGRSSGTIVYTAIKPIKQQQNWMRVGVSKDPSHVCVWVAVGASESRLVDQQACAPHAHTQ